MTNRISLTQSQPTPDRTGPGQGFWRDSCGTVTAETMIILPILVWALVAMPVFFSAFHTRTKAELAAITVVDLISRNTETLTHSYLEGMNEVYDELVAGRTPARLRISSLMHDVELGHPVVQWSYGTRDVAPLPMDTFQYLFAGDYAGLFDRFNETQQDAFGGVGSNMPAQNMHTRIPPILPGEALILVESFTLWTPFASAGLGQMQFAPVAVARPRWSPWLNLEGANALPPTDDYEPYSVPPDPDLIPEPDDDLDEEPTWQVVLAQDFSDFQAPGWSEPIFYTSPNFATPILGRFGRETIENPLTFPVNLGAESRAARIEFDLYLIDNWNGGDTSDALRAGDAMQILINSVPITHDAFRRYTSSYLNPYLENDRHTRISRAEGRFDAHLTLVSIGNFWGGSSNDAIWRVTIDIDAPVQHFTLGLSAMLDQDLSNESFGIGNFQVSALQGARNPTHFVPDPAALWGVDVGMTRFPVYSGCPDPRHGAPSLTLRASNFETARADFRFNVSARGMGLLADCELPILGEHYNMASPTFVLNYDNEGISGPGRRLLLRTNQGENTACRPTMLLLDPHGQWWFNPQISYSNWTSALHLGDAASGTYRIWLGNHSETSCWTRVNIAQY